MAQKVTRRRRTFAEIFLDTLKEKSGGQPQLIGNLAMREALQWDVDRYDWVKQHLIDEGKIIVGRGKGGSVGLASAAGTKALNVFISYSHADENLKDILLKHLEPLRKLGLIENWHDRKIQPGSDFDSEIKENMNSADVVLLLVSIDFVNSRYCYDVELEGALERHRKNQTRVIPIILRACLWHQTPIGSLQALPKDGKPVTAWPNLDEAFTNVADGIGQVAKSLLNER